jgi:hypothetical protein
MTENTAETPPESPVDGSEPDTTLDDTGAQPDDIHQEAQDDDDDEPDTNPNREAAKWRRKFREAQEHLAGLDGVVRNLQVQAVETMVREHGITASALWAVASLDDLLDPEFHTPDQRRVADAVERARRDLGITRPSVPPGQLKSGSRAESEVRPHGWKQAFSPKER